MADNWQLHDSYPLFMNDEFTVVESWDGTFWWGGPMSVVMPFEQSSDGQHPGFKMLSMNGGFFGPRDT